MEDRTDVEESLSGNPSSERGGKSVPLRGARITPTTLAVLAGVMSLGLGIYQLSLPHVLAGVSGWDEGYDEGVYVGAAIRFVHGVMPYRDFILLHPPGFILLMSPVALIGRGLGAHATLEIARCVTVLVIALNAVLAGLILRPLGRVATGTAAFALALWPLSIADQRTVELEPYLVFFCLLGTFLIFKGAPLASLRRVLLGGMALGFAVNVKVWAVLPIAAVIVVCLPKWRSRGLPLVIGIAVGGIIPCLPFFVAAPHAFVHEVISDQLSRNAGVVAAVPIQNRLLLLTGLGRLPVIGPRINVGVVVSCVFGLFVVLVFASGRRRLQVVEWFALVSSVVVFAGMFEDPSSYEFYSYFPAAFTALLLGVTIGGAYRAAVAHRARRSGRHRPKARYRAIGALTIAVAIVCFLAAQEVDYARSYLALFSDPAAALASVIPPGACVVSDTPTLLLVANRFTPADSGCPAQIDTFGSYLAEDNGATPYLAHSYPVPFEEQWFSELEAADYVVMQVPYTDYFPWASASIAWFKENYRLVAQFSATYPPLPPLVERLVPTGSIDDARPNEYIYENESILRSGSDPRGP